MNDFGVAFTVNSWPTQSGFMSAIADKGIGGERSFAKGGSTGSSPDVFDDDAAEFKPNLIDSARVSVPPDGRARDAAMGGLSLPHHGLAAAIQSHGHANAANHHLHYSPGVGKGGEGGHAPNTNYDSCKSPFLLPAQLYKSLFANAVLQSSDKICSHPFPRNLLFSYAEKSPASPEFDAEDKGSVADEVSRGERGAPSPPPHPVSPLLPFAFCFSVSPDEHTNHRRFN